MSYLLNIIDEVDLRIRTRKALSQYTINDFAVVKSWLPYQRLETMPDLEGGTRVYIVGLASNDQPTQNRVNTCLKTLPVQVGLQKSLEDVHDFDEVAGLVTLEEELRDTCRKYIDLDGYSWSRTDSLVEDDGTPFQFVGLREGNFFEAYFTAHYNLVLA